MFSLSFTFLDNPCLFFISFTSITVLSFFKVVDRDSETRPQLIFGLLDIFSHCSVSRELGSSARFDLFYIDLLWVNVLLCGTKIPHHLMFFGLNSSLSDNFLENLISTSSGKFFFLHPWCQFSFDSIFRRKNLFDPFCHHSGLSERLWDSGLLL